MKIGAMSIPTNTNRNIYLCSNNTTNSTSNTKDKHPSANKHSEHKKNRLSAASIILAIVLAADMVTGHKYCSKLDSELDSIKSENEMLDKLIKEYEEQIKQLEEEIAKKKNDINKRKPGGRSGAGLPPSFGI